MPLNPATLINSLIHIDDAPLNTAAAAATAWAGAYHSYASQATVFNPLLSVANTVARDAFYTIYVATALPGLQFSAWAALLKVASTAYWAAMNVPLIMAVPLSTVTPPPDAPVVLASLLAPVAVTGLAASEKTAVRTQLANAWHTWTITGLMLIPPATSPVPLT